MDNLEAVKKILKANGCLSPCDCDECQETADKIALKICELFGVKPAKSRLLTDEEIKNGS